MEFLKKFTKKDLVFSLATGFVTGIIAWRILVFLGLLVLNFWNSNAGCRIYCAPGGGACTMNVCIPDYAISLSSYWLVVIIPVLWIIGVNFGYFLGRFMPFFNQFGRYAAVGFTNFFVDAGVLNLQIGLTGIESGWHYSLFKTISFVVAVTNSYLLNKYWVFDAASSDGGRSELFRFLSVYIIAIVINVGVASFVVNYIQPFGGIDAKEWANLGSVAGSAVAIIFTFIGSRLVVFKKSDL